MFTAATRLNLTVMRLPSSRTGVAEQSNRSRIAVVTSPLMYDYDAGCMANPEHWLSDAKFYNSWIFFVEHNT